MENLLEWQIVIVGIIASVLVQIIRFIGESTGKPLSKVVIQWVVFGISLALGLWWGAFELPALPPFGGPESLMGFVEFAGALVALAGQLLGIAYLVYAALLKRVFDSIEPLRI